LPLPPRVTDHITRARSTGQKEKRAQRTSPSPGVIERFRPEFFLQLALRVLVLVHACESPARFGTCIFYLGTYIKRACCRVKQRLQHRVCAWPGPWITRYFYQNMLAALIFWT